MTGLVTDHCGRKAPEAFSRRGRLDRSGFSLPELLIVLAILVAMTAFALPAMRGPLDKGRLRSSATSVRAALGRTRSTAIRRGQDVSFHYELNGNHWRIELNGASFHQSADTENGAALVETPANSRDLITSQRSVIQEGELPQGCTFVEQSDSEFVTLDHETDVTEPGATSGDSPFSLNWARPIRFRPNGRSEDAEIFIRGSREFAVRLDLRGLTGGVSYSAPFRMPSDDALDAGGEVVD